MFERFTERARQVVVFAQDEARALGHDYVGTEHLLLGLLREEAGIAARVLESFDITVEEVRAQVARIVGEGDRVAAGEIPFTPRAKKALEIALREAMSLGGRQVGPEHILLGLVRETDGVAARILVDFDVDAETIRTAVVRALSPPRAARPGPPRPRGVAVRWEYEVVAVEGIDQVSAAFLNVRGDEGWELVAITEGSVDLRLVFKRPRRAD